MKRWTIIFVVVALLVAAIFTYRSYFAGIEVDSVAVRTGTIRQYVDERAKTHLPIEHAIMMPYNGRVEPIDVEVGQQVKKGEPVVDLVKTDLELARDQAVANRDRVQALIRQSVDDSIEQINLRQALNLVVSIGKTLEAAKNRVTSGEKKLQVARRARQRIESLAGGAKTEADLDQAELDEVEASVDYNQDKLVHVSMQAIYAAAELLPTLVRQNIDRKKLEQDVLQQQLAEAEAALAQAELDLRRARIESPVDGVVLQRPITGEQVVSAGTTLLVIGQLEKLQVEVEVLSEEAVDVHEGDPAEIYGGALGDDTLSGIVRRVDPDAFTKISSLGVEQQRVKVIVDFAEGELAQIEKTRQLGVGYRVRVRIVTNQRQDVPIVPRSAVFRSPKGKWQAYVVKDGRITVADLSLGLTNDRDVEVVTGLSPGDLVIPAPPGDLEPGARAQTSAASGERQTGIFM